MTLLTNTPSHAWCPAMVSYLLTCDVYFLIACNTLSCPPSVVLSFSPRDVSEDNLHRQTQIDNPLSSFLSRVTIITALRSSCQFQCPHPAVPSSGVSPRSVMPSDDLSSSSSSSCPVRRVRQLMMQDWWLPMTLPRANILGAGLLMLPFTDVLCHCLLPAMRQLSFRPHPSCLSHFLINSNFY